MESRSESRQYLISRMSKLRNFWEFAKTLRVEPLLFIFSVTVFAFSTGDVNLTTQKVCFPEGPPGVSTVCTDKERLKAVADVSQVKNMIRDCGSAVLVLIAGAWRDVYGRTLPLVVIPTIFEIGSTAIDLISYIYWDMSPMLAAALSSSIAVLGGSKATVTMASLSYITATSTEDQRAMRMPVLMVAMMGGMTIATLVTGYLLTWADYQPYFIGVMVLYAFFIICACFMIKDKRTPASEGASFCDTFIRFKVLFKSRPNNGLIWMFIMATSLITCMLGAEGFVCALYFQGQFKIPPSQLGLFSGYKSFISLVAGAIAIPLLKNVFKLSEITVVYIAIAFSVTSCVGLAFSQTLTHLYIFGTFDLLRIVLVATLMHLFQGLLQKSEIGLFTSFLSFVEGMLPLGLNPLYTYVYKSTIDTMPGAFFFVSAGMLILSGITVGIISCIYKPVPSQEPEEEVEEEGQQFQEQTTECA